MNKQGQTIVYVLIGLLVVVGIISIIAITSKPSTTGSVISEGQEEQNCREIEVPYEEQEEYLKTEYYTETVPYTETECEEEELSYRSSHDDLERDVECINSHEECAETYIDWLGREKCKRYETVCDEYREYVSFEITNLDTEKGYWQIEWKKFCRANQPLCSIETYETIIITGLWLDPTETKTSSYSIDYDAKGQEYLYAYLLYIPTKQICEEVTRYKEVQRTKQITAYRPVTKYKSEEVCE